MSKVGKAIIPDENKHQDDEGYHLAIEGYHLAISAKEFIW